MSRMSRGQTGPLSIRIAIAALSLSAAGAASAITFDVIGPGEYDLPVDFAPFIVFVQYATVQDNEKVRDARGKKVDGDGSQQIVGLSKYVRFWSPEWNRRIGLAYEIIVPEIGVRNEGSGRYAGGLGDPLTGFAAWYRPTDSSTFGIQSFLVVPVGNDSVSDTNWKNLTSLLWNWKGGNWQVTGNGGFVWQGERTNGVTPVLNWHTNNRFGYRLHQYLEPFIGLDYEYAGAKDGAPKSWAFDVGGGVVLHTFKNQSIALRYSTTVDGESHAQNDSFNLKYVYVW
ncbi:transporter [Nevskia sp.]|uniref:transporter n=1 Tax=Nevskia sp. TaxID=1929292 RepID=UPI003F72B4C0